jgi:integrase
MSKRYVTEGIDLFLKDPKSKNLSNDLVKLTEKYYPKVPTQATSLSKLKRILIDTHFKGTTEVPKNVMSIQLAKAAYGEVIEQQHKRLKIRGSNPMVFKGTTELVNSLLDGLTSDDSKELFLAVAMATGRRYSEIKEVGGLKVSDDGTQAYSALFTGQLKQKDEKKEYEIPLLAPYWVVKSAFDKLRKMNGGKAPQQLVPVLRAIPGMPTKATIHTLRGLYAMYLYKVLSPKASINEYVSSILGHVDANTSVHYTVYKLKGVKKPYEPWEPPETEQDAQNELGWVANGSARERVVANILELHRNNEVITARKLRTMGSGYIVIKRVIDDNRDKLRELGINL